ncbi:MAG: ECF-type sigma factor, partial [Singulisphaera sp.]
MATDSAVRGWIKGAKAGDPEAVRKIWEHFIARLEALARLRLGNTPRRATDEQDVLISVFKSFAIRAREQSFSKLNDPDDLWQILVVITDRKARNQAKYERRKKRSFRLTVHEEQLDAQQGPDASS